MDPSIEAASWVISQAIVEGWGYKWPEYTYSQGTMVFYPAGPNGASGVGTFMLALYRRTHNQTYLSYAEGAANWICYAAISENGGYKWPHPDLDLHSPGWWLSNIVADIGGFLLKMYFETHNQMYLFYAKGAAQWLISMKVKSDRAGYFVPYNPPYKYGSQAAHGISPGREAQTAGFLLRMYQQSGNESYLQVVKDVATWLIDGAEDGIYLRYEENGGYKWLSDIPWSVIRYGLSANISYWLTTTAHVALYFLEAYNVLGNETYLRYAKGGIDWLLSQTIGGCKWPDYPSSMTYQLLPWHRISMRLTDLLVSAYTVTGNSTYMEYAKRHANWVVSQAVVEGDGYKFPDYEGIHVYASYIFNSALVHSYLCMMYEKTGNSTYLDYAEGIERWYLSIGVSGNPGIKWATLETNPYYDPCWPGTSGIGYYLIGNIVEMIPEFSGWVYIILFAVYVSLVVFFKFKKCKPSKKPTTIRRMHE